MTKKIAVFVEGQTEQIFLVELIKALAGKKNITFEHMKQHGGELVSTEVVLSGGIDDFYFLIVSCNNDNQVNSQIKRRHQSLTKNGYSHIVGIRDIYPSPLADLPLFEQYKNAGIPQEGTPVEIVLAVLETEAWFIAESTHFERLPRPISPHELAASFGIDRDINPDHIEHPAILLDDIYRTKGMRYEKRRLQVTKLVRRLSMEEMYTSVASRSSSFRQLVSVLENAMTNIPSIGIH